MFIQFWILKNYAMQRTLYSKCLWLIRHSMDYSSRKKSYFYTDENLTKVDVIATTKTEVEQACVDAEKKWRDVTEHAVQWHHNKDEGDENDQRIRDEEKKRWRFIVVSRYCVVRSVPKNDLDRVCQTARPTDQYRREGTCCRIESDPVTWFLKKTVVSESFEDIVSLTSESGAGASSPNPKQSRSNSDVR